MHAGKELSCSVASVMHTVASFSPRLTKMNTHFCLILALRELRLSTGPLSQWSSAPCIVSCPQANHMKSGWWCSSLAYRAVKAV